MKIAGTNKDKRRALTNAEVYRMKQMVAAGKKTTSEIATKFGVSSYTVKYNTDPKFKASELARKKTA